MVHISTAPPAGSLAQQVQRNSSIGILAVATDAGFFLLVTLLKMFSSMLSPLCITAVKARRNTFLKIQRLHITGAIRVLYNKLFLNLVSL